LKKEVKKAKRVREHNRRKTFRYGGSAMLALQKEELFKDLNLEWRKSSKI
jgi:hypothetical protein